jgi:hypothetical protein
MPGDDARGVIERGRSSDRPSVQINCAGSFNCVTLATSIFPGLLFEPELLNVKMPLTPLIESCALLVKPPDPLSVP